MSSMACAAHLFALFSRERSLTHPEQGLVPVNVLQNCPEAEPPQCATVSKALLSRLHGLTVKVGLNRHLGPQGSSRRTGRAYPLNFLLLPCWCKQPVYRTAADLYQQGFRFIANTVVRLFRRGNSL
ncbi:MAG: hypothetical protein LBD47_13425 [Treponema sp.]|jgi:hypothetical protein|nr:hypothetical protein [Treponema sp.]